MDNNRRCIILPCAGSGSRLGLPYPKELHFVLPGKAMIDLTVGRLDQLRRPFFVLVVLCPGKAVITSYLRTRWPAIEFKFVDQHEPGFIGAVRATRPCLGADNLLLLPDQYLDECGAIEEAFGHLEGGADAAVLAQLRPDHTTLADEGAVRVSEGKVVAMAEKPGPARAKDFNAAWCGLGFKSAAAGRFIASLAGLYESGPSEGTAWSTSPLKGAPVALVDEFSDLGTWDRLVTFQRRNLR